MNLNVAVGANCTIITSADGITWTPATNSGTTSHLYGVTYSTYNSGTWIAVGAAGTMVESSDGLTWHAVTYGTQFVAVGSGGNIVISTDGMTWTPISPLATSNNLYAVARGSLAYSAVGAAGTNLLSK